MGEKQLDLNAPLLSVRRFSSPSRSSASNSLSASHGSGKWSSENKLGAAMGGKEFSPPVYQNFVSRPVRDPGTVPFVWETVPGRPKDSPAVGPVYGANSNGRPPAAPGFRPGKVVDGRRDLASAMEDEDREIDMVRNANNNPAAQCDAFETQSLAELSMFNDSIGGASGLDALELKRGGNSASGRRFMLDRFLPAAKAMASEAPQHAPRKQPLASKPLSKDSRSFRASDKLTWEAVYKPKFACNLLYLGVHDGGISPYRNEVPSLSFREGSGFLGIPKSGKRFTYDGSGIKMKGFDALKDTSQYRSKGASGSATPTIEKTVYVDSISAVETSNLKSRQTETEGPNYLIDNQVEEQQKQGKLLSESHFINNNMNLDLADEGELLNFNPAKPVKPVYASNSNHRSIDSFLVENYTIAKESKLSIPLVKPIMGGANGSYTNLSQQQVNRNSKTLAADINGNSSLFPSLCSPSLPKSPTESWLCRTLPAVPTQNSSPFSFPQHHKKKNAMNGPADSKWETIIKGSIVHPGHWHFSEELSQSVPYQAEI